MSIESLTSIFRDVFEDELIVLKPELAAKDVKNWDSFNHINLMIAIESAYGITLAPAEVQRAKTVGDLVQLLQSKGCAVSW